MPFSMFKMGYLSPMLILLLMMASVCMASPQPKHICQYDEMRKEDPALRVIQNLPNDHETETETLTVVSDNDWQPIRILVSFKQLNDTDQHCKREYQRRKDEYGREYICTKHDVLTVQRRKDMKRVVYSAVKVHSARLKVVPVKTAFHLPYFHTGSCSRLLISDEHHRKGVQHTDMVLYVSAKLFSRGTSYGYGFPCAIDKVSHRPLVGGLLLNTRHIIATDYTVRALTHEIAHALGFDHEIVNLRNLIQPKLSVRGKDKVNEFRGEKVIEKVKRHYNCSSATGMEFEDEIKVSKNERIGSLWESRNAKDELMAGIVRKGFYTYFTLAFFEDLGCYKADYSKAEHMDWGYKAGCEFLTKPCIENGKSNFPLFFCSEKKSNALFCTSGRRTMGRCIGFISDQIIPYPSYFQYFSDKKMTGLSYLLTDQCPYIEDEEGGDCRKNKGMSLPGKSGERSWCLPRTKDETKTTPEGHRGVCAEATEISNDPEYIFDDQGARAACLGKNAPLSAPGSFNGMHLNCPTSEILSSTNVERKESLLATENDMAEIYQTLQYVVTEHREDSTQKMPDVKAPEENNEVTQEEMKRDISPETSVTEKEDNSKGEHANEFPRSVEEIVPPVNHGESKSDEIEEPHVGGTENHDGNQKEHTEVEEHVKDNAESHKDQKEELSTETLPIVSEDQPKEDQPKNVENIEEKNLPSVDSASTVNGMGEGSNVGDTENHDGNQKEHTEVEEHVKDNAESHKDQKEELSTETLPIVSEDQPKEDQPKNVENIEEKNLPSVDSASTVNGMGEGSNVGDTENLEGKAQEETQVSVSEKDNEGTQEEKDAEKHIDTPAANHDVNVEGEPAKGTPNSMEDIVPPVNPGPDASEKIEGSENGGNTHGDIIPKEESNATLPKEENTESQEEAKKVLHQAALSDVPDE